MNLLVTSSPHIHSGRTTSRLMADVLIALIPAVLAGFYFFGLRAAILMVVSIASCKIAEFLWCAVRRQPHTLRDCSAAVTGLLLALTLPVSVPYWVPVVGGFFAMIVVKGLGGGLGQNTFNPALAARALLVLLFPAVMTRFAPVGTAISSASMSTSCLLNCPCATATMAASNFSPGSSFTMSIPYIFFTVSLFAHGSYTVRSTLYSVRDL